MATILVQRGRDRPTISTRVRGDSTSSFRLLPSDFSSPVPRDGIVRPRREDISAINPIETSVVAVQSLDAGVVRQAGAPMISTTYSDRRPALALVRADRFFYCGMALAAIVTVFIGFS